MSIEQIFMTQVKFGGFLISQLDNSGMLVSPWNWRFLLVVNYVALLPVENLHLPTEYKTHPNQKCCGRAGAQMNCHIWRVVCATLVYSDLEELGEGDN